MVKSRVGLCTISNCDVHFAKWSQIDQSPSETGSWQIHQLLFSNYFKYVQYIYTFLAFKEVSVTFVCSFLRSKLLQTLSFNLWAGSCISEL